MIVQEDDGGGTAEGLLWITNHPHVEATLQAVITTPTNYCSCYNCHIGRVGILIKVG